MNTDKTVLRVSPGVCSSPTFVSLSQELGFQPFSADSPELAINFVAGLIKEPAAVTVDVSFWDDIGDEFLDFVTTVRTMIKIKFRRTVPIAVLTHRALRRDEIRKLQCAGASGVMPRTAMFGFQASKDAYQALLSSIEHWPKFCVEQPTRKQKEAIADSPIQLTDRQLEVQRLLCERGLSNKGIARHLNISESTVKIHVSAILKRYGVRNRTQLALAVNKGARL